MKKKLKTLDRIKAWFGSEKKAKSLYEKKTAAEIWDAIPEEKKDMKYHSFQSWLWKHFRKSSHGGARPGSGNRREKRNNK